MIALTVLAVSLGLTAALRLLRRRRSRRRGPTAGSRMGEQSGMTGS